VISHQWDSPGGRGRSDGVISHQSSVGLALAGGVGVISHQ